MTAPAIAPHLATFHSGDLARHAQTGRCYRLSVVNYNTGKARASAVTVDAAGVWRWLHTGPVTIQLAAYLRVPGTVHVSAAAVPGTDSTAR